MGTVEAKVWMKEQTKFRLEMTTQGMATIVIIDMEEGVMYNYMPDQNMAMEMTLDTGMIPEDPLGGVTEMLDYNPDIEGTEKYDGKDCIVVTWDIPGTGKAKAWIWTQYGFPLKMETTTTEGTIIIEFKNVDFSDIPDSVFELPEGVTIIES
jgi:outer membrane lipoprotein-sorting protein